MDDLSLIATLYWDGVRVTNEVNSKIGITKGTLKEEELIIQEVESRFNLGEDNLRNRLNK